MSYIDNYLEEKREGAPFNMALDTLWRIADILDKINSVSFGLDLMTMKVLTTPAELGEHQILKHRLVKQLFITAVPLLSEKHKESIRERFGKVKLATPQLIDNNNYTTQQVLVASMLVETQLDELTIFIQECLQEDGHFMPKASDPRHSWKRT